jgi:hypothetical protein
MWALSREVDAFLWPFFLSAPLAVASTYVARRIGAPSGIGAQLAQVTLLTSVWALGGLAVLVSGIFPVAEGATTPIVVAACAFVGFMTGLSAWLFRALMRQTPYPQ